jgi:hypothetical protein
MSERIRLEVRHRAVEQGDAPIYVWEDAEDLLGPGESLEDFACGWWWALNTMQGLDVSIFAFWGEVEWFSLVKGSWGGPDRTDTENYGEACRG